MNERFTTVFKPLKKLKYLSLPENALVQDAILSIFGRENAEADIHPHSIVAQVPNLQTLILFTPRSSAISSPTTKLPLCEHHGNTLIVTSSLLMSRELSVVKQIGPLLKKSN
jgi:hypothetical protein